MTSPPKNERVQLRYIQWDNAFLKIKPYELLIDRPPDYPRTNFRIEPEPAEIIHDIRGHEDNYTLDANGFAIRQHAMTLTSFDRETVESEYFAQLEALLRSEVDDVGEVFFFDWRVGIYASTGQKPTDMTAAAHERYAENEDRGRRSTGSL